MIVQLYLENVEIRSPFYFELNGGVRIRSVFRDERANLNRDFSPNFEASCVIEKLTSASELSNAEVEVEQILRAMLLFHDKLIRSLKVIGMVTNLRTVSFRDAALLVHQSSPTWRHALNSNHMFPFRLASSSEIQQFKTFWSKFAHLSKPGYFQMATDRFARAIDMIATKNQWPYRLIEYITSLEALLTEDEPELSYKLSMRTISLLQDTGQDSVVNFNFMKKMYNLRSKLLHGVEWKVLAKLLPVKIDKKQWNPHEAIDDLHSKTQRSLRSVFELLCKQTIDKKKVSLIKLLDERLIAR